MKMMFEVPACWHWLDHRGLCSGSRVACRPGGKPRAHVWCRHALWVHTSVWVSRFVVRATFLYPATVLPLKEWNESLLALFNFLICGFSRYECSSTFRELSVVHVNSCSCWHGVPSPSCEWDGSPQILYQ